MTDEEKTLLAKKVINRTNIRKDHRRHLMVKGYMIDCFGVRHHVSRSIPYAVWLWDLCNPNNPLTPGYNVHHKDENKLNDDINNLVKITSKQHAIVHMKGNAYSKGKILSQQHKDKIRQANIGKHLSPEHRKKIAQGKKRNYELKRKFAQTYQGTKSDG